MLTCYRKTSFAIFVLVYLMGRSALAFTEVSVPEVGMHTPLLKVEKNENPQNWLIVYTKIDPKTCSFETKSGTPVLDEYWLMNGRDYKRVHPLIKNAVASRFELDREAFSAHQKFMVHLKDFSELKSDLGSTPTFEVTSSKVGSECKTNVVIQLGPSDRNRKIAIAAIYADSSKKALPPFRKLNALTLIGKDMATGEVVSRKYSSN